MLLRQRHRPLLRSVTAAWRPATTSPAPYRRGDSRGISDSSRQQEDGEEEAKEEDKNSSSDQHGESSLAPAANEPPLFEKLHPKEAKAKQAFLSNSNASKDKKHWAFPPIDEEPPRLALPPEELQHRLGEGGDSESSPTQESDAPGFYTPATRAKSMLILSGASKTLLASDFVRLGVKGKHVEGWVGGILKVIQARDPDTLEPKGHYFILFDSHEAAAAYKDRVEYLWQLGKAHVPGAHHARTHMRQQPLPRGLWRTEHREDVAQLIRTFTLVPPSQRLQIIQSRTSPAKITQMYLEGGFVDQLAARAGSKFLVLLRLDGGRLSVQTLRRAIKDDGKRRHLPWRITDLDKGILPFGKSVLKAKDRVHVPEEDSSTATTTTGAEEEGSNNEIMDEKEYSEVTGQDPSTLNAAQEAEESNKKYRRYPRFVIPFMDEAEAHRFVQNWHRRELKLRMGGSGRRNDPTWEETRIINATVLW